MKLAISNIAWGAEDDENIYDMMVRYGYKGLEIAPTRIFPTDPYGDLARAEQWSGDIRTRYGFYIPSIQSIWYGRQERLFGSRREQEILVRYTEQAVGFAAAIGCRNLVFGCPKNRSIYPAARETVDSKMAIHFFRHLGNYAASKGTVIGMEANPRIYGTDYINDTHSALGLIRQVGSDGFRLNLDVGTMIQNGEDIGELKGNVGYIQHVHISEPGLEKIKERGVHRRLSRLLEKERYPGYVSIEMKRPNGSLDIEATLQYVKEVFGDGAR